MAATREADAFPALSPDRELTSLLARAFLRYWRATSDDGEKGLDLSRDSKRSCPKPSSEGAGS